MWFIAIFLILISQASSQGPYYIWHWHLHHEFDAGSLKTLEKIPIKGLFYRTASFSLVQGKPSFSGIRKRKWFLSQFRSLKQFEEIHLCYTFGNSSTNPFVTDYLNQKPDLAIPWMVSRIQEDFRFFKKLNPKVKGVQIDLEGGDIQFDLYARLLHSLRGILGDVVLSITPMSGWVKKKDFQPVADASDFIVPMLYDFHRGKKPSNPLKVTDYHWLKKMVKHYDSLGKPVIYGIPTYSYCVLYDESGKMKVPWAVLAPNSATENHRLELEGLSYNQSGKGKEKKVTRDRVLSFRSVEKWRFSNMKFEPGSILKYNYLSPSSVNQYLEAIESTPSKWGSGVAFFRFGTPGESLVLNAKRLKQAIDGHYPSDFRCRIEKISVSDSEFFLVFTNLGKSTYFGKTGFKVSTNLMPEDNHHPADFDDLIISHGENRKTILTENLFQHNEMLLTPLFKKSTLSGAKFKVRLELNNGLTRTHEFALKDIAPSLLIP
jgi:hypothetical protein